MAVEEKVPVMKRESLKRRRLSSSNEDRRGKMIWLIGREVDLLSKADEGK